MSVDFKDTTEMSADSTSEEIVEELTCNSRESISSTELLLLIQSN